MSVGPFAYLRPGTHPARRARRSARSSRSRTPTSARGTKVPHLSYIGDADVGEDTNLGAATITANYDAKSKTKQPHDDRRPRASRASTSRFVAPVTVGDDAYTAAGSVITDDVPPKALGVARERQRNVEGYADRKSKEQ